MAGAKTKVKAKLAFTTIIQHWVPPIITVALGLIAGISLAAYNSDLSTNRFFLEKQTRTADNVAVEFSRYIENWARLVRLRKQFDTRNNEPSAEEKEFFKRAVFERADARDKLFSSFDSTHLYYSKRITDLVVRFREWDDKQSELTIEKLPNIEEWRKWQVDILRQLHEEISK